MQEHPSLHRHTNIVFVCFFPIPANNTCWYSTPWAAEWRSHGLLFFWALREIWACGAFFFFWVVSMFDVEYFLTRLLSVLVLFLDQLLLVPSLRCILAFISYATNLFWSFRRRRLGATLPNCSWGIKLSWLSKMAAHTAFLISSYISLIDQNP